MIHLSAVSITFINHHRKESVRVMKLLDNSPVIQRRILASIPQRLTCLVKATLCLGLYLAQGCFDANAEIVTIDATIKSVNKEARSITVTTKSINADKKNLGFEVAKKAKIIVDGKLCILDDILPGRIASISYDPDLEIVTQIEIFKEADSSDNQKVRSDSEPINPKDSTGFTIIPTAFRVLKDHSSSVMAIAFRHDSSGFASVGDSNNKKSVGIILWQMEDFDNGNQPVKIDDGGLSVDFSHDDKFLAVGRFNGSVAIWDLSISPPKLVFDKVVHRGPVVGLVFSPKAQELATSGREDCTIRLWKVSKRGASELLNIPPRSSSDRLWGLQFSPDSKLLVESIMLDEKIALNSGSERLGCVRFWDMSKDKPVLRNTIRGTYPFVRNGVFSKLGESFAFVDGMGITITDQGLKKTLRHFEGQMKNINALAFIPNSKYLASASHDDTVRIWDSATGVEAISLFANRGGVEALAISPNRKYMASGGHDKTVLVWKLSESNAK